MAPLEYLIERFISNKVNPLATKAATATRVTGAFYSDRSGINCGIGRVNRTGYALSYPCVGASPAFAYGTTVATGGGTSAYAGSASASVAAFAYGKSVSAPRDLWLVLKSGGYRTTLVAYS